jgi:hypothetical protein
MSSWHCLLAFPLVALLWGSLGGCAGTRTHHPDVVLQNPHCFLFCKSRNEHTTTTIDERKRDQPAASQGGTP